MFGIRAKLQRPRRSINFWKSTYQRSCKKIAFSKKGATLIKMTQTTGGLSKKLSTWPLCVYCELAWKRRTAGKRWGIPKWKLKLLRTARLAHQLTERLKINNLFIVPTLAFCICLFWFLTAINSYVVIIATDRFPMTENRPTNQIITLSPWFFIMSSRGARTDVLV